MTPYVRAVAISLLLLAVAGANLADANSSGKTGSASNGCGCHSTDVMISPTMNGLPNIYTPGLTYALSWTGSGMTSTGEGGFNLDASGGSWTNLGSRVKLSNGELTHSSDLQRSWSAEWIARNCGLPNPTTALETLSQG